MQKRLTLPTALLSAALLVACGGGQGDPSAPDELGNTGSSAPVVESPTSPQPVEGQAPIGAQPVQDTPVATIPAHQGHEPITVPMPAQPSEPVQPVQPQPTYSKTWVVSAAGTDTAAGTAEAPFRTIGKAISVVQAGELVRVRAGTYNETLLLDGKDGTAVAKITLQGEGNPKVTPGASGAVVQFKRQHWIVDGFDIDVQGQARFAVTFDGNTSGSVIANSEIHHGTLGAGVTTFGGAQGATIENNHIHHFSRGETDSHGISVQTTSKNITVKNNDIHDNSGDSVQCLGPEGFNSNAPADGLVIEGNHFYSNRENAVDIKTCHNVVIRNNRMHGFRPSSSAKGDVVVIHYSAKNVLVENNDIFDGSKGISVGGNREGPVPSGVVIQKNRIHDIVTEGGGEGTGIRLENSDGTKLFNNTVVRTAGYALRLGGGTGGATSNLVVKNNVISSTQNANLGAERPGLVMAGNLYGQSGSFGLNGTTTDFATFKSQAGDVTSLQGDAALAADFKPGALAIDKGENVGLTYCGAAPDLGAVETGC